MVWRETGRVRASLPMYDRPELIDEHDRYWSAIRRELAAVGIDSPLALDRGVDDLLGHWRASDLVLSQTCGLPYRQLLYGKVTLIGTPDYGLEACPPGYYQSAFVVSTNDDRTSLSQFAHARFAYNETMSQSGYNAPKMHLEPLGFWFVDKVQAGGHVAAASMVANGAADIASIDAVTWRLMCRHDPWVDSLRVLEATIPTPGLPYIAAAETDAPLAFAAVERAIASLSSADREALGIRGLVAIAASEYLSVPTSIS